MMALFSRQMAGLASETLAPALSTERLPLESLGFGPNVGRLPLKNHSGGMQR